MVSDKQVAEFWQGLNPTQRNQLMRDVMKSIEADKVNAANNRYLSEDGIIEFVRTKLGARKIYPYQERILRALVRHKRVAARSPHGAGKTTIAAWFTLWAMSVYDDVKIPTLAPTDRQAGFVWSEIRKWSRNLDGKDFRVLQRRLDGISKEAFSVSSDDASNIEGVHSRCVGYVFDEAKSLNAPFWEAAEGAFSNADNDSGFEGYWLAISTPGNPAGTFYDIHSRKAGLTDWHTEHVTIEEAVQCGAISRQWVNQRREAWGETSAVYRNRVLAEFDESGEDNVIPLAWIEAAQERYYTLLKSQAADVSESWGIDPARYGEDKTAIAHRRGRVITKVTYTSKQDTMQTSGKVASMVASKTTPLAVDVIGIGAGVVDRLHELGFNVTAVNVGEAATDRYNKPLKDITGLLEFANLRSWLWFYLRDSLNPDNPACIALPPGDLTLVGDLCTPQYTYLSNGRIIVESKEETRKRLKRSTDGADSVALALLMNAPHMTAPSFQFYRMT